MLMAIPESSLNQFDFASNTGRRPSCHRTCCLIRQLYIKPSEVLRLITPVLKNALL